MRWKLLNFNFSILFLLVLCVIQCEIAVSYKSEIEITPSPIEEPTTKKSGFFSGIKNFFRGSPTTEETESNLLAVTTPKTNAVQTPKITASQPSTPTTTVTGPQKPPALIIPHAPLMPIGPRPDTPSSSPLGGNQHLPPQWPQAAVSTTTTVRPGQHQQPQQQPQQPQQQPNQPISPFQPNQPNQPKQPNLPQNSFGSGGQLPRPTPNLPPGFQPYRPKPQPSGLDLSYGGGGGGVSVRPLPSGAPIAVTSTTVKPAQPQQAYGFGVPLAPVTPITTTTTTQRPTQAKEDFPALPAPRRPSIGAKEDFPILPTPKSSVPTPVSPLKPSSPSAWNVPLSTPTTPAHLPNAPTPAHPVRPGSPSAANTHGGNGVSFVPHAAGVTDTTTTVRPGFKSEGNSIANDDEIRALTENLFTKEVNSQLNLIRVNIQGKTRSIDSADEAPQPLLQIDEKAFEAPTIEKMRLLFNNYETDTTVNEYVTPNERKEENDFVDAVMATSVMRQTMQFLQNKGIVTPDPKSHRDLIKELWFTQYSRGGGKIGSSGFEHVFVNEVKNGTIIGLHNWVYFYEEEKAGRLDYKGYMNQLDLGTKGKVLKARFSHNGLNKPVNTLFIGTSPELELALYTVCFKVRPDRTCPVSLDNKKFGIVTYSWRYRGKNLIGSAYPEI